MRAGGLLGASCREPCREWEGRGLVPGAFTSKTPLWALDLEGSPSPPPERGNGAPYCRHLFVMGPGGGSWRNGHPGTAESGQSLQWVQTAQRYCVGHACVSSRHMRQAWSNLLNREPSKMICPVYIEVIVLKLGTSLPLGLTSHPMQEIQLTQHSEQKSSCT